jgi:uncharacterized SAM-binding protein YcdF (DUF218 family)
MSSFSWLITNFIAAFLLPPLNLIITGGLGLLLLRRRRAWGKGLIVVSLAGLWLLATPLVGGYLLDALEPPRGVADAGDAEAIVILGGGTYHDSLEYGGDTVGRFTLERVRYGAWLARRLDKPILVTGGSPDGGRPEGQLMRETLEREFAVNVRWVEDRSDTTRDNARYSADILKQAGIGRIYLVSHAWHLRRALPEFERAGLRVVPAGIGYSLTRGPRPLDFVPNAKGLYDSYLAMHEGIGLFWYYLRN